MQSALRLGRAGLDGHLRSRHSVGAHPLPSLLSTHRAIRKLQESGFGGYREVFAFIPGGGDKLPEAIASEDEFADLWDGSVEETGGAFKRGSHLHNSRYSQRLCARGELLKQAGY